MFEFDESFQVMLPGPGGQTTRTCAKDSNVAKMEENRGVYWLPGSATESTNGAPLCKFSVARLVVEATTDSETEFNVNATQLEESEETRRLKHKTLPRHVSKDKHDARQIAHHQCRSRSGATMDLAHRPRARGCEQEREGSSLLVKCDKSTTWSREQHFQPCGETESRPDWWERVKHSDQLTGLG